MFSSESTPIRNASTRSLHNSRNPFTLGSMDDEFSTRSPIFSNKYSEGLPTPDLSPNLFKSPQASIIRSPSYGIASNRFSLNEQDRFVLQTPKANKRDVDLILEGKPTLPPSEPLNTLSYVFPILIIVSFLLLFIVPPFAFIFCFSLVGYAINTYLIKKENKKKMSQAPRFCFPTPKRF
ncbi:hypothetical protein M9Y10_042441 [Tritrichomonas musculus]|uniref:Uncharacterized protein n=1 Tax=Tritrichomonas musculus TaxID=1915356 RepID=A0ABR2GNM5_9EUKA